MSTPKSGLTLSGHWKILHLLLNITKSHSACLRAMHKMHVRYYRILSRRVPVCLLEYVSHRRPLSNAGN
jgi:hypothetical protein